MRHILMDGTQPLWLDGHTNVLGRLLHKSFKLLPHIPALWWGMGRESGSRKILWWGSQPLCSQFSKLYKVISMKNHTISIVLANS